MLAWNYATIPSIHIRWYTSYCNYFFIFGSSEFYFYSKHHAIVPFINEWNYEKAKSYAKRSNELKSGESKSQSKTHTFPIMK